MSCLLGRLTEVASKILLKHQAAWFALAERLYEQERVDYPEARKLIEQPTEGRADSSPVNEAALILQNGQNVR